MHQGFPDEIPRKLKGVHRQVSPAESLDAALMKFHRRHHGSNPATMMLASPRRCKHFDGADLLEHLPAYSVRPNVRRSLAGFGDPKKDANCACSFRRATLSQRWFH